MRYLNGTICSVAKYAKGNIRHKCIVQYIENLHNRAIDFLQQSEMAPMCLYNDSYIQGS